MEEKERVRRIRRIANEIDLNHQMLIQSLIVNDLHHASQAMENVRDLLTLLGVSDMPPLKGVVELHLRVNQLLNKMTSEHALYNYVIRKEEEEK